MVLSKSVIIKALVALLVIVSVFFLALYFGLQNRPSKVQRLRVSSEVGDMDVRFVDTDSLVSYLDALHFWDEGYINSRGLSGGKATASTINVFVVENISDPNYIQADTQGELVISSKFDVDDAGVVNIYISPGTFVKHLRKEESATWMDSQFWTIVNTIGSYGEQSNRDQRVFVIE